MYVPHGGNLVRMPQLDALRAIAVLLVIVSHWLPDSQLARQLPVGMFGVTLFFVLNGFLITRILLQEKQSIDRTHGARWRALGRFYARRALRIFPVYYLTLLVLWWTAGDAFRSDFGWYAGYASNVLLYREQVWLAPAPHLWTLAVEEQFYLLWPLLVLAAPARLLGSLVGATVLLGPASRSVVFLAGDGSAAAADSSQVLMPSCMDCFGLGALLALRDMRPESGATTRASWWAGLLLVSVPMVLLLKDDYGIAGVAGFRLAVSVMALALIARASAGFSGPGGRLMGNPALAYVGRISYGMYLFHLFIPGLYRWLGLPAVEGTYPMFVLHGALLLVLAAVSWHLFEAPFNRLKSRFAYHPPQRPPVQDQNPVTLAGAGTTESVRIVG